MQLLKVNCETVSELFFYNSHLRLKNQPVFYPGPITTNRNWVKWIVKKYCGKLCKNHFHPQFQKFQKYILPWLCLDQNDAMYQTSLSVQITNIIPWINWRIGSCLLDSSSTKKFIFCCFQLFTQNFLESAISRLFLERQQRELHTLFYVSAKQASATTSKS